MELEGWEADVRSSQLEIYNDSVRDLMGEGVPVVDIREVRCWRVLVGLVRLVRVVLALVLCPIFRQQQPGCDSLSCFRTG